MTSRRDRIAAGYRTAARIAAIGGAPYLPIFERMERENAALGAVESALDRARRIAGGG